MQTVFIFTHLIMVAAASAVLYFNFKTEPEPEQGSASPVMLVLTAAVLVVKFRALRYRIKSSAGIIADRLARWKNTEPVLQESGQTVS